MAITQYDVIAAHDINDLQTKISAKLLQGYLTLGEAFLRGQLLYQAVAKGTIVMGQFSEAHVIADGTLQGLITKVNATIAQYQPLNEPVYRNGAFIQIVGIIVASSSGDGITESQAEQIADTQSQLLIDEYSDGVAGFSSLRDTIPRYEGQKITLKYHSLKSGNFANNLRGGGVFIARQGTRADDGGFTAKVTNQNWYWERDININDLTVDHFGAVGDGVTDDAPAFLAMYNFLQTTFASNLTGDNAKRQFIKGTASNYACSDMDFTQNTLPPNNLAEFGIVSVTPCHFGLDAAMTITNLSTSTTPLIKANHRRVVFQGVKFIDNANKAFFLANRDTTTFRLAGCSIQEPNATAPSKKPFFKNICQGGQYLKVDGFLFSYTGGIVFDLLDTIGTRINEINGSYFAERVIETGWSNQTTGVWDHSTDFEISRFNFQYGLAHPFRFSRMCQGVLSNGWIEHGAAAGQFDNSQFVLNAFSIEDCKLNAIGWKGRFIIAQNSTPTGNMIDMVTAPTDSTWYGYPINSDGTQVTQWRSDYEMGSSQFEAAYTVLKNAVSLNYLTGALHGNNPDATQRWLKVGTFETRNLGSEWHLTIEGTAGYDALRTGGAATYASNNSPAKCMINLQRPRDSGVDIPASYKSTISYEGSQSAVVQANIITQSSTLVDVWIQVAAYCGGYSVHVTGTGPNRKDQGICDRFVPGDGTLTTTAPAATGNAVLSSPEAMGYWGSKTIGFGFSNGMLVMSGLALTTAEAALYYTKEPAFFQWIMAGNNKVPIPYVYALIPVFTTQPTAKSVTTGGTLTLTAAATESYAWQWYKDGVIISGATSATYTKANVTSADAGNYYVNAIGRPTANIKQSNTVAVTVTA